MFEDATFESTGRIRTRSRNWMVAAFAFNASILLALILIPLIYPEALSRQGFAYLLVAPDLTAHLQPQPIQAAHAFHGTPEFQNGQIFAPPRIPPTIGRFSGPEAPSTFISMNDGPAMPNGGNDLFRAGRQSTAVHAESKGPVRVSSTVVDGLLIHKTLPIYPPIAKAAGIQGTVVLQATISKTGTIENLRVVSGPSMLQQAAFDAVQTWRYRPYLLNGAPVEVETAINVVFKMRE
ncbi:MAG TPA: energy transducer TonB [Terracidiphilus sp.]|nr:energy transducer TonB [Terracidiphilus sp.]